MASHVRARAAVQAPFTVGGVTAPPGTVVSGELAVPARAGDSGTTIPFSILNGVRRGPVLALIAGTHGAEYPSIIALQRLRTAIAPGDLAGTIIMIHVANMPSYLARTVYYSPVDHQNLNRVYPGKPDGTLSERIAHTITREVIDRCTHLIDLHSGDANESLWPYVYWFTNGSPEVTEAGRQMVLAFGIDHIVVDGTRPTDPAKSFFTANTAILRGKPAMTTESGGMGLSDEESIVRVERGVAGVLRQLEMRATGPAPVEHPVWLCPPKSLRSAATGIFYAAVERNQNVSTGTLIGHITDFHGTTLEQIRAPFDGQILYVIGTPPTTAGEPIASITTRATKRDFPKNPGRQPERETR
jgi:predicted deacylase